MIHDFGNGPLMRALGIDLGEKRVGIAVTDPAGLLAVPLCTLDREHKAADRLRRVARLGEHHDVGAYIVGLPVQMDGIEGEPAAAARAFGERLAERTGKPVHLQDERLTSVLAHELLAEAGVHGERRKALVDQMAAVLILQGWLDGPRPGGGPPLCG